MGTILPTLPSPPAWETSPMTKRLGRSKLEVMGQTLLLTPQGQDLEQQPASLPGLGAAWEALSTIPNLKPSAVQEELLGPKRSAEQYFFFPVPLFPLSSFVRSKLRFNAHHQVSKRRTSSVWRQRWEARAARRWHHLREVGVGRPSLNTLCPTASLQTSSSMGSPLSV